MKDFNQTIDHEFKENHMKEEEKESMNMGIIKKAYEYLDDRNMYAWKELMSPVCKAYLGSTEDPMSFEDLIPMINSFYSAFPDYKHITEHMFAKGDYVVTRMKYTGTQKDEFMNRPPANSKIEYKGIFIFQVINGKITEVYGVEDELNMMMQLGFELK
jgi:predicted ester cyclase